MSGQGDHHLAAGFYDPARYDLDKPGRLCVGCSHPDNVDVQRRIFHPDYRGCTLAPEKASERR